MKSLTPKRVRKPEVGDLFICKTSIDVIDSKGEVFSLTKGTMVQLLEIHNTNPQIMLEPNVKFIANWKCKFIYQKRAFTILVKNSSHSSMLYDYFDQATEEILQNISDNAKNNIQ